MTLVRVADGPDARLVWHAGAPLREQRVMSGGAGVLVLANREVLAFDEPRWELDGMPGVRLSEDGRWAHTDPGWGSALLPRLRSSLGLGVWLRRDLTVVWRGSRLPDLADAVAHNLSPVPDGVEWIVERDDAVDATGRRLSLSEPLADGIEPDLERPVGLWAYEALRIAAGVPRVGVDLPLGEVVAGPLGAGPDAARSRTLVRLLLDADDLPAVGTDVMLDGRTVGRLGSAAQHHQWGPIAWAACEPGLRPGAVLDIGPDAHAVLW